MQQYIKGEDGQKKSIDVETLNKNYKNQDLENPAYNEFWSEMPRRALSVKPSRPNSKEKGKNPLELTTPERKRREVRELYLPEITKNTWIQKKEIDFSTLYEDPLFDMAAKRRNMRGKKGSLDGGMI